MIDLTKKTEDELKVIAYDLLVKLDIIKQNLQIVNQELAKRAANPPMKAVSKEAN